MVNTKLNDFFFSLVGVTNEQLDNAFDLAIKAGAHPYSAHSSRASHVAPDCVETRGDWYAYGVDDEGDMVFQGYRGFGLEFSGWGTYEEFIAVCQEIIDANV